MFKCYAVAEVEIAVILITIVNGIVWLSMGFQVLHYFSYSFSSFEDSSCQVMFTRFFIYTSNS